MSQLYYKEEYGSRGFLTKEQEKLRYMYHLLKEGNEMRYTDEKTVRSGYRELTLRLIQKGIQITAMESATAGQFASLITDTEGSSQIMKGSFVTSSNEAKVMQGVPEETIREYGVYSRETALGMAQACRKAYDADIGIGVTGTMGNVDPANSDSIPGQVYFAIARREGCDSFFRELEPCKSRLEYKMCVCGLILEELNKIVEEK